MTDPGWYGSSTVRIWAAGFVQAIARPRAAYDSAHFRLRGLRGDAVYKVTDIDTPEKGTRLTGKELMNSGVAIQINAKPQVAILTYQRIEQ